MPPNSSVPFTLDFEHIALTDVPLVGGKNASLGELYNALRPQGINVVDGFATTVSAYRYFLEQTGLIEQLRSILSELDPTDIIQLSARAHAARTAILHAPLPDELITAILDAYHRLVQRLGHVPALAVRSSATAEDLPEASFAGQQETFLNIRGEQALLDAVHACFASLFTDRAISYRSKRGIDHLAVGISVGVQPMVRSDLACSGVIFTLDPESGFRDVVVVTSAWGLGEYVVQGVVSPDEWIVFKPTLVQGFQPIISRRLGSKEVRLVYGDGTKGTRSEAVPDHQRRLFSLTDAEVLTLAQWACRIEKHYSHKAGRPTPMDIEWAKDGISGALYILQARPETVHSAKPHRATVQIYRIESRLRQPLLTGQAVGERVAVGRVRVIRDVSQLHTVQPGEVLVAPMTDPDWEPVMKRVAAIVTDQGGRTAHAAIVSRELGLPCVVGTERATSTLATGMTVTVSCAEGSTGYVYEGEVPYTVETVDTATLPSPPVAIMVNLGDPSRAFSVAALPTSGVGLARIEFIIASHIGIHPLALARYPQLGDPTVVAEIEARIGSEDPREYFVRRLSEGIGHIAAAFYPKPVIVRTSDFKTNEYARLLGGHLFEPQEENPMLGFRGASRYYDPRYKEGFALECAALHRVRSQMGLTNVKVMIPFCRTPEEARRVIATMAEFGLRQGENGLEIYGMCELPSNVILADQFLQIFDGYSIGSNDLTQLVLGIDRDSGTVAHLFDEQHEAVRQMIASAIAAAKRNRKPIGICGQAPSDNPDFAAWLVAQGIDSISLNPDALVKTITAITR
ncbi:MAG: phosphoenolpyruvate synthase [Candidatus Kapabacteria bacterium]|nr:phosphoenolpyruvate synthase [Candidatus Kapabacteria bacterium]